MRFKALPIFFLGLIFASGAAAQDGHYWDNQYGTKGQLLGGLVVGNPADLSATFYNPGWVALSISPGALVTTKAGEIYFVKVKSGPDGVEGPSSSTTTKSPGYLAGRFSTGDGEGWQWAYSYLQKVKFKFSTTDVKIYEYEAPPPDGPGNFTGEAFRESENNEYWYGFTISKKLTDNLGLGFSPYGVYRSMKKRVQIWAQDLDGSQNLAQFYEANWFDTWHARLLCKIGLAYEHKKINLGLTMTTPSVGVIGRGTVYSSTSLSGVDLDDNGEIDDPFLASNYQEDLKSTWKSPLSIAAGANWTWGKAGLFVSMEWFNSLTSSKVMDSADFPSQSDGEVVSYDLQQSARSVFNYGVGFNYTYNKKFAAYGAFRSDYSSIPNDISRTFQVGTWDLWHLTGGMSFTVKDMDFTAGIEYAWGSDSRDDYRAYIDENGEVSGEYTNVEISYKRLKGLIGFNVDFGQSSE